MSKYFRILVIALSLWFAIPKAGAQTHYTSNIAIGAHGGIDSSYIFFSPGAPESWPLGGSAGLMFRYIEENHFGLIIEANWMQRGWGEDFEGAPYNYHRITNYVEVPFMAHIYFGRRGKFFINVGPEVSFFIGESTKANFDPANMNSLPDFPIKNRTNTQMTMPVHHRMDYGITGGLGGEFNINKWNSVSLEVRAYFGLGNVMPDKRADVFSLSNQLTIAAEVGYWFRVK